MRARLQSVSRWSCLALALVIRGCAPVPAPRVATPWLQEDGGSGLFRVAQTLAERGDWVRAEQYAALALERGFDAKTVLRLLLHVCLQSSRLSVALAYAERVQALHADDTELLYVRSALHVSLGQWARAQALLQRLLATAPAHAPAAALLVRVQQVREGEQ